MPEEKDTGAEALARALELELAQKRLHWQRGREKYRTLRVLSFGFPVHRYSRGADCILLFLLTHERNARTTSSTFAGDRRIATLRSARDRGKDSIGHVVDMAPRRFAELTPRKAHPDRNTDFQVCAPSGVLLS